MAATLRGSLLLCNIFQWNLSIGYLRYQQSVSDETHKNLRKIEAHLQTPCTWSTRRCTWIFKVLETTFLKFLFIIYHLGTWSSPCRDPTWFRGKFRRISTTTPRKPHLSIRYLVVTWGKMSHVWGASMSQPLFNISWIFFLILGIHSIVHAANFNATTFKLIFYIPYLFS